MNRKKIKYSNIDILKYLLKKRCLPLKLASKIFDTDTSCFNFDECFKTTEISRVVNEAVKYMKFSKLEVKGDIGDTSYLYPIKISNINPEHTENEHKIEDYNYLLRFAK